MTDRADLPARLRSIAGVMEQLQLNAVRSPAETVATIREAAARIEALEAALKPFADLFEASEASATKRGIDPTKLPDEQVAVSFENVPPLTVGLFRRARAALSQTSKPEGETR